MPAEDSADGANEPTGVLGESMHRTTPAEPHRGATVAHVAARAGVSKATAARALGEYGAVSARVRARVMDAAAALGYRPNEVARSMSTGRSHAIGIIVGDIENPAFALATRGAADVVEAAGYDLLLSNSREDADAELKAIEVQLAKRVDGMLIAPASSLRAANYTIISDAGRPFVFFDRLAYGLDADAVIASNREGARRLTQLLLDAGHRRIAYISSLNELEPISSRAVWTDGQVTFKPGLVSSVIDERVSGFVTALYAAGVEDPFRYVCLGAATPSVSGVVSDLLSGSDAVTAIVASDSIIAIETFRTVRHRGLRIPEDVSLVSFDNAPWTSVTEPNITVVAQPERELGSLAAEVLIQRIEGATGPASVRTLTQVLVERGSVAPPAAAR